MRFSVAVVAAVAGLVSAQTTTTTAAGASGTSSCAAQNIVDACLASTQPILEACTPNDWKCMCESQQAVVTCYNNCPGDPLRTTANQQLTVWCQAASAESSRSVAASGTPTVKSSAATKAAATTAAIGTGSFASGSASASATSKGAAATVLAPAGGLFAVALGVAGLF